ncbi:hypothetical protein PV08_07340 [Exophiala spinifera]|uniref:Zn(2)-C6 fungal-type domain-containing protein n=1 Tax=Exophiala spinifera TaxID=91928 RepID=A0A0D1YI19_9EURO|nr:uncharacterized protein PV08_07340 [Exophiala spinifera]KIW14556.1 hypothetical protein PV08_07340 [Exophiala spinifera]
MPLETEHRRPRRRARHEKSNNGCSTCKIRRIKCDETTPQCRRCTASGRECSGPLTRQFRFVEDPVMDRTPSPVFQLEVSLLSPRRSEPERRAFQFFEQDTVLHMPGTIDENFVGSLLPCLAHTYDFIWDTIVSVSYLIKYVPYLALTTVDSAGLTKVINKEHRQALSYYHRAILSVRQMAEIGPIDECIVVLSYIQFAGVEFRQRNVKVGHYLFKKACSILSRSLASRTLRHDSPAHRAIHQVVTPFIFRKAVVIATLGDVPTPESAAEDEISRILLAKSPELQQARVELYSLVSDCYELVRIADFIPNIEDGNSDKAYYMSHWQSSLDGLRAWKAKMIASGSPKPCTDTECIYSYLMIYCNICYISVATCLSISQMIFDKYTDGFAEIIHHAKVFLGYCVESPNVQLLLQFDPGIVPLLYFCATKCRDPMLRREALCLMSQALRQERENHWALIEPERVVETLIAVEEDEKRPLDSVAPSSSSLQTFSSQTPLKRALPPDGRRYTHASAVLRQAPGGRLRLAVELVRFETGIRGQRKSITDYAWLDDPYDKIML